MEVSIGKSPKKWLNMGHFPLPSLVGVDMRQKAEPPETGRWRWALRWSFPPTERFFYRRSNSFLQRNVIAWS